MKNKQCGAVWVSLLLVWQVSPLPARGASAPSDAAGKIKWTARFAPPAVRAGEETRLRLEARVEPGWHTYSLTQPAGGPKATEIGTEASEGLEPLGAFKGPDPQRAFDAAFQMDVESYAGSVAFERAYRVSPRAQPGTIRLRGTAEAMACDSTVCLPPRRWPFEAEVQVLPGTASSAASAPASGPARGAPGPGSGAIAGPAAPKPVAGPLAPVAAAFGKSSGLWVFILAAMASGFAALLTPCVFPMIPITVSFFTKRSGRASWRAVWQAALYSLSIVGSFMVLGLLLSAVFGAAGANRFAANPWVNLAIAALFLVFALSLFGAFEIRVPVNWLNRLGLSGEAGGPLGILLMGFVFTVTSFTCTVGFVGFVLVLASQGAWLWPVVGMFFFAAAFSLPFFFLALFPQLLGALPKSGGWLNSVKVVMGLLEFGFAFKFLSNIDLYWSWGVFTRPVLLAAWTAVAVAAGLYLLGLFRLAHDGPSAEIGAGRLVFALFFLAFSLYLSRGLFGMPINGTIESYLPPPPFRAASAAEGLKSASAGDELAWFDNYDTALKAARQQSRPLFIDFTGVYCTNCRLMENQIFPLPQIKAELARFVLVRLFTDKGTAESEANQQMQIQRFGSAALPFYAIVDPNSGNPIATFAGMTWAPNDFRRFLLSGLPNHP